MENIAAEYGILIQTLRLDDEFKVKCIEALSCICSDKHIIFVTEDIQYHGYRVFFSSTSTVAAVLSKRFMIVDGTVTKIFPLVTNLLIHNIIPNPFRDLCNDICTRMKIKFGKVLKLTNLPLCSNFPHIKSGNWHVVIDVPEIEWLDVFVENGLPNMSVKIPGIQEKARVSFTCAVCAKHDHSRQSCPMLRMPSSDCAIKVDKSYFSKEAGCEEKHNETQNVLRETLSISVSTVSSTDSFSELRGTNREKKPDVPFPATQMNTIEKRRLPEEYESRNSKTEEKKLFRAKTSQVSFCSPRKKLRAELPSVSKEKPSLSFCQSDKKIETINDNKKKNAAKKKPELHFRETTSTTQGMWFSGTKEVPTPSKIPKRIPRGRKNEKEEDNSFFRNMFRGILFK